MITLTWAQINHPDFVNALIQLHRTPKLDQKTAYRVGRIFEACKMTIERCRAKEKELILANDYIIKNDKGETIVDQDGFPEVHPDKKEEFNKAFKSMAEKHSITIKVMPISLDALGPAGLPAAAIIGLTAILTGLPEDETGEVVEETAA